LILDELSDKHHLLPWICRDGHESVYWKRGVCKLSRLLRQGVKPAEVARRLKVSRTSVWRWEQAPAANGQRALRKAPRTRRPPQLGDAEKKLLITALKTGALAQGCSTPLWTLARVGRLIMELQGRYSESGVWHLLKSLNASERDEAAIRR
jgi:transposase